MSEGPQYFTAAEVRAMDRHAIEELGIPAFELMQRAGKAAFAALRARWPDTQRLLVFCGTGNNGGDGFVVAGLARDAGLAAEVWLLGARGAVSGTAREALDFAASRGVALHDAAALPDFREHAAHTVIVDALLGIGLTGTVRPPFQRAIEAINNSGLPVLAVDLPSGLCSDTGRMLGACVKAELTVTFIGRKRGLIRGEGPAHAGTVVFADLGVAVQNEADLRAKPRNNSG